MGKLDVVPETLEAFGERYAELGALLARLSPAAVDEAQRIIASHGKMGYPVAVGILTALARREQVVLSKAADFQTYCERFLSHAAAYRGQDAAGAEQFAATFDGRLA